MVYFSCQMLPGPDADVSRQRHDGAEVRRQAVRRDAHLLPQPQGVRGDGTRSGGRALRCGRGWSERKLLRVRPSAVKVHPRAECDFSSKE